MATISCPFCETELERGAVCPRCGWDTTADSELLPTLFSAAGIPSRAARGEECLARAAEAEREDLYLRFGRTVFAGQTKEDLRRCAEAEDPAEGVRRLAALLGVTLGPEPAARDLSDAQSLSPGGSLLLPAPPLVSADPASENWRGRNTHVLRPSALLPSAADKKRIQAVRFQDSFRGLTLDHWDVSEAGDGSVLACLREEYGLLTLLICGEDGIYAPEDCSCLFLDYKFIRNVDFGGCFHTENCTDMNAMFFGCLSLKGLDMRGLDTSQVKDARAMFCNCDQLVRVVLPRGLTAIQSHMFEHCTMLKELTIPDGIVGIGDYAFYDCAALDAVSLPDSVIGVGRYAFKDCTALKSISLSRKLLHLDSGAFWGCSGLSEIVIPGTVNRIESRVFHGCSKLRDVYYVGTGEQWQRAVEKPNEELEKAMIQFSI